jgi:uncharacterized protein
MPYIARIIEPYITDTLKRGKSILLFGARQTGKTTLLNQCIKPNLICSFIQPEIRQRYEQNPSLLGKEILSQIQLGKLPTHPTVAIDEVQKIPLILDVVQDFIDRNLAQFILIGSSARKLHRGTNLNLLPGRVVRMQLDPLTLNELPAPHPKLEDLLLYGTLPGIITQQSPDNKTIDLHSYVKSYLEDEVRAEALVRNIGPFIRFLEFAASESGNIINFNKLSQEIGVTHTTIAGYYQILEDCLIVEKITPLTKTKVRRKLTKTAKYLFFDLGIRRIAAEEGTQLPQKILGQLFEQFIILEFIRLARMFVTKFRVYFWRDHNGPEIDLVIATNNKYIPIEIKWTTTPTLKDCRHLKIFQQEYPTKNPAFIICQTPQSYLVDENIIALPWQEIGTVLKQIMDDAY